MSDTPAAAPPSQEPAATPPAEPTTPVTEPTTPPAEPTTPVTEPVTPVTEPVTPTEPVTQPPEPVVPPVEPTAEPPAEPAVERVVPAADGYKLPEGVSPEWGAFANQNDMTQEQLDSTVTMVGGIMTANAEAQTNALRSLGEAHLKNWGDGAEHKLGIAKRALAQNDSEGSLAKALNETGYGNHPAVLDFLYNLGMSMQEGGFLKGTVNRPPGKKTAAQTMFPNMKSVE